MAEQGILVACDQREEWLLPWWWSNYCCENTHPVLFVDLGMSEEKRHFCKERGELIPLCLSEAFLTPREKMDPSLVEQWESFYGSGVFESRKRWFKKPFAMSLSSYKHTLWLDLDCEVLGSLAPLFDACECASGMALAREVSPVQIQEGEVVYNSGVVVFRKGSPLLKKWTDLALLQNHRFCGDQDLLSHLIFCNSFEIQELPQCYNWRISQGVHPEAQIVHWVGSWGKEFIKKTGGLRKLKEEISFEP